MHDLCPAFIQVILYGFRLILQDVRVVSVIDIRTVLVQMVLLDDLILRDRIIDLALRTADRTGDAVLRTEGGHSLIRSEPNAYDEIRFIFQRIAFRCRTVKEPELIWRIRIEHHGPAFIIFARLSVARHHQRIPVAGVKKRRHQCIRFSAPLIHLGFRKLLQRGCVGFCRRRIHAAL